MPGFSCIILSDFVVHVSYIMLGCCYCCRYQSSTVAVIASNRSRGREQFHHLAALEEASITAESHWIYRSLQACRFIYHPSKRQQLQIS